MTDISVLDLGADLNGFNDSAPAFQKALNIALTSGGRVVAPAGTYLIQTSIVPAYFNQGTFTSGAGKSVTIQGDGMYQTVLKCGSQFPYNGLIGYGRSGVCPIVALVTVMDLTIDGDYPNISQPQSAAGALVSLPWPHTSATSPAPNGKYHHFERVRFYRASGYGFQPTQGIRLHACEFDTMGQPDATIHYDNMGSGSGDAMVEQCNWHDSAGNYADFVDGSATGYVHLTMTGCKSFNHKSGGVYALGTRSVISGNTLQNVSAGSGIGYDGGTNQAIRANNNVSGNSLGNIAIGTVSGNGDVSSGNN